MEAQAPPAEIPVLEEHSQPPPQMMVQDPAAPQEAVQGTPEAQGLSVALPPSTATATPADAGARRWSLDLASSTHSDWELLSTGHQSHCGSSPRSVSPSDAYDSEAEAHAGAEDEAGTEEHAHRDVLVEDAAAQQDAAPALDQPEQEATAHLEAFGSLVLPPTSASKLPAGETPVGDECPSVLPSDNDSPRSSYERPSSRASGHDLYSLTQDGSVDSLSEDEYIGSMMLQGEPDHAAGDHSAHSGHSEDDPPASAKLATPNPSALASSPAATVAAAVYGACSAASHQLRELAASVSAMLARVVPASAGVAGHVMRGVAVIVDSLRERVSALPAMLAPFVTGIQPHAAAVGDKVAVSAQHMRKGLGYRRVNWAKVALALGVSCSALAALLWRSWAEQARLAALLSRRETDLSKLLMKVMELQRNITHRGTPLIRHVSAAGAAPAAHWPAVIVV